MLVWSQSGAKAQSSYHLGFYCLGFFTSGNHTVDSGGSARLQSGPRCFDFMPQSLAHFSRNCFSQSCFSWNGFGVSASVDRRSMSLRALLTRGESRLTVLTVSRWQVSADDDNWQAELMSQQLDVSLAVWQSPTAADSPPNTAFNDS